MLINPSERWLSSCSCAGRHEDATEHEQSECHHCSLLLTGAMDTRYNWPHSPLSAKPLSAIFQVDCIGLILKEWERNLKLSVNFPAKVRPKTCPGCSDYILGKRILIYLANGSQKHSKKSAWTSIGLTTITISYYLSITANFTYITNFFSSVSPNLWLAVIHRHRSGIKFQSVAPSTGCVV